MVDVKVYTCPEWGLSYREKSLAKTDEASCKEHNSCNLEITKYSVNKNEF